MIKTTCLFLTVTLSLLFVACNKEEKMTENTSQGTTSKVHFQDINDTILESDISKIIEIDLNDDRVVDIAFEIVNLNNYDQAQHLNDSLAARAINPNVELMDESTYGYPDALDENEILNESRGWIKRETAVLGTNPSAHFQGKDEKYLGFRLVAENNYFYGWVKLECSEKRDVLRIISCGISEEVNKSIHTGQK
jgi:hypothetical protein